MEAEDVNILDDVLQTLGFRVDVESYTVGYRVRVSVSVVDVWLG